MMGGVVRVSVQRWMKSAILKEARYSKYANVKRILDKHSFDRSPEGLALTPVCLSYHDRIAGAFTELRLATAPLKPEPGKVLTSVTPTFVSKWLIPKLPDVASKPPDIDLRIRATKKLSSFHSDDMDLAVRQGYSPFSAGLNSPPLFKQDLIALAAPKLLKGMHFPIILAALSALPKVHDRHNLWPDEFADLGIADKNMGDLRLSQTAFAVNVASFGQRSALVSHFLVSSDLAAGNPKKIKALQTLLHIISTF